MVKKENLPYLALSVFLAIVFWTMVRLEGDSTRRFEVPVDLVNIPNEYVVTDFEQQKVTVVLRGSRTALSLIDPKELRWRIDLSNVRPGLARFEMGPDRLNIPRGVRIDEVSPWEITLNVETRIEKTLPVKAEGRLTGSPAEGYEVTKIFCTPAEVRVVGPESRVDSMKAADIGTLDVTGLKAGLEEEVPLALPQEVTAVGSGMIKVKVDVAEKIVEKIFEDIPLKIDKGSASYYKVAPDRIRVKVRGRIDLVRGIRADQVSARADLSDMKVGYYPQTKLPVVIPPLPNQEKLEVTYEPKTFDVSLYK